MACNGRQGLCTNDIVHNAGRVDCACMLTHTSCLAVGPPKERELARKHDRQVPKTQPCMRTSTKETSAMTPRAATETEQRPSRPEAHMLVEHQRLPGCAYKQIA